MYNLDVTNILMGAILGLMCVFLGIVIGLFASKKRDETDN